MFGSVHRPGERHQLCALPKAVMQIVSHVTFRDEMVCLDDKHFMDCSLSRCVLDYSGEELMIERTEFHGCRLKLNGAAGRTLNFLQCMGYTQDVDGLWHPATGAQGFQTKLLN